MGCGSSSEQQANQPSGANTEASLLLIQKTGEFQDDYKVEQVIGQGSYGVVKQVRHKKTGELRVVKQIIKQYMRKEEIQAKIACDIIYLRKIDHPNVVKPFEFYNSKDYFYVVTELIEGGNLLERLEDKGLITEKECSNIIKQVLSVLVYCHKNKIMHRDLKPENIMLEVKEKYQIQYPIKVIDWGSATLTTKKNTDLIGTPFYIAPEIVSKKPYNEKCDLWSLGAIIYTILSGEPPFFAENLPSILSKVKTGKYQFPGDIWDEKKGGISNLAQDFIKKLMEIDPVKRFSAEQALQHEWLEQAPEEQVSQKVQDQFMKKLKKFQAKNKLQEAALIFISQQFAIKQTRDEISQAFLSFDTNKDGTLSREEILAYYEQTMTPEAAERECNEIFSRIDVDDNGIINYSEFVMGTYQYQQNLVKQQLREAFDYFDSDKNGFITLEELQQILGQDMNEYNQNQWQQLVAQIDKNNDGKISFNEFNQMMKEMAGMENQLK